MHSETVWYSRLQLWIICKHLKSLQIEIWPMHFDSLSLSVWSIRLNQSGHCTSTQATENGILWLHVSVKVEPFSTVHCETCYLAAGRQAEPTGNRKWFVLKPLAMCMRFIGSCKAWLLNVQCIWGTIVNVADISAVWDLDQISHTWKQTSIARVWHASVFPYLWS